MKFAYTEWENIISWENNQIPTVVVENQLAFREFLCELSSAINGASSKCTLSQNDNIINISKRAEILSDFIEFDINRKSLLNKIVSSIEQIALSGEQYLKTQELLLKIESAVDDWSFDFSCDVVLTKLSVTNILKSLGIEIKNDYSGNMGELEKIIDYMTLFREFDTEKMFVLVNIRSFFDEDAVEKFIETAISHQYKILLFDAFSHPIVKGERRITIDKDLCEF